MTNQPSRDARHRSLHRRLTVALADASKRAGLADALNAALAASGGAPPAPLRTADLVEAASTFAAARADDRAQLRARLEEAAGRAEAAQEQAAAELAALVEARDAVLDRAASLERVHRELPSHRNLVDGARASLDARQADLREAQGSLERVLEQRAAATAAMEEADRQLGDISSAGMDESGLRRELESANRAVREAEERLDAARADVERLEAERAELEGLLSSTGDGADPAGAAPADPDRLERVLDAFEALRDSAAAAMVDKDAVELAEAWQDLEADLAEALAAAPPVPSDAELSEAEARVGEAAAALEAHEQATTRVLTPEERAELEAAHAAVIEAEERATRRVGAGSARKQLAAARAAEQELLERYGFASHLEVVLSGGRAGTTDGARAEAERAYLMATTQLDALRQAQQGSPTVAYLRSEEDRLRGHAVEILGVDPGDRAIELLRQHPRVPGYLVQELREALAAAGVEPVGSAILDAAEAWLVDQRRRAEQQAELEAEQATRHVRRAELEARAAELETLVEEARRRVDEAAEGAELAQRSVEAFEAELTVRAGEDTQRLKRLAAAEQLRAQVDAVQATLAKAESTARERLAEAEAAHAAAAVAYDDARAVLTGLAREARSAAEGLPADDRPEGDPLSTLLELADALRAHAEGQGPDIAAAAEHLAETEAALVEAREAVVLAAGPDAGLERADFVDGLAKILREAPEDHVLVLDDPFDGIEAGARDELLGLVRDGSADRPVVLLTDDADILGWAIELPADVGTAVPADALLARTRREVGRVVEPDAELDDHDRPDDHRTTTSSSPRRAGRR